MTSRVSPVDTESVQGQVKEQFNVVKSKFGMIPNTLKVMAQSPSATLDAYMSLSGALIKGVLSKSTREAIALAVSQFNGCEYCISAHTLTGKLAGLSPEQTLAARRGNSADPKTQAVLDLTFNILERRGRVSDEQINEARRSGLNDGEVVEIVGNVTLMILTNYLNNVARTDIDFPKVSVNL